MMQIKNFMIESGLLKTSEYMLLNVEKIFFQRNLVNKLRQNDPIIVYQMGKVASATIYHSLQKFYQGLVLHTHTFEIDDLNWQVQQVYQHGVVEKEGLYVISLTREPIGRNISAFFQNFTKVTGIRFSKSNYSLEELKQIFLTKFDQQEALEWFDHHILANLCIDIYQTPFPQIGYEKYTRGNIRLLVMRSEIDDDTKISAIRDFLHIPELQLIPKNIGTKKSYADVYRAFTQEIKFPESYITEMYESKYMRHFYDSSYINNLKKFWSYG